MGFYHVWLNQGIGNVTAFLNLFKQRLTDNFIQNWLERLSNSSRANFYINIADFKPKAYLNSVKVLKFRNSLARLRVSSHRLEIEAGRWARPHKPVNERLCHICNCLEDEYHFFIKCSLYNSLRRKYIDQVFWLRPNMYEFINLVTSDNTRTITNLAIYVHKAFRIRNNELFAENNS